VDWSPAKDLAIDASLTGIGRSYLHYAIPGRRFKLYRNVDGIHFQDVSAASALR